MPLVSGESSDEPAAAIPDLLKPAVGTAGLESDSVETKEPFLEVKEAKNLHPVTSDDPSEELHPDIPDPGKCKYTSNSYVEIDISAFFVCIIKAHSLADLFCALILRFHFPRIISFLPAHSTCRKTSQSKKMKTRFL